jgi:hypothetical protein
MKAEPFNLVQRYVVLENEEGIIAAINLPTKKEIPNDKHNRSSPAMASPSLKDVHREAVFDKVLLLMGRSIGGLFLFVKGHFAPKNRGWRCGWVRHVDRWPLL